MPSYPGLNDTWSIAQGINNTCVLKVRIKCVERFLDFTKTKFLYSCLCSEHIKDLLKKINMFLFIKKGIEKSPNIEA